uniref:Uncharacterized protein n=1 Tax=Anopheles quadriannulatus TaxID=34691 RepID=A0A182XSW7_ANOQN
MNERSENGTVTCIGHAFENSLEFSHD